MCLFCLGSYYFYAFRFLFCVDVFFCFVCVFCWEGLLDFFFGVLASLDCLYFCVFVLAFICFFCFLPALLVLINFVFIVLRVFCVFCVGGWLDFCCCWRIFLVWGFVGFFDGMGLVGVVILLVGIML